MTSHSLMLALSTLLITACSTVSIIQPKHNEEVVGRATVIAVQLHKEAEPSTLRVALDGVDITDTFSASPFGHGTLVATPEFLGPYVDNEANYRKNVNSITASAMPKRTAESTPFMARSKSIAFNPSLIRLCVGAMPASYYECNSKAWANIKEGDNNEVAIYVRLDAAPTSPLTIKIMPSNRDIVLNNSAAGEGVNIEVPTNNSYAKFNVRRVSEVHNITSLLITAKGYGEARLYAPSSSYYFTLGSPNRPPTKP